MLPETALQWRESKLAKVAKELKTGFSVYKAAAHRQASNFTLFKRFNNSSSSASNKILKGTELKRRMTDCSIFFFNSEIKGFH